jgi:ABC-type Fe3+ transport system permease subunit
MEHIPFTTSVNRNPVSIFAITTETLVFAITGLILGIIVDKLFVKLSKKYKNYIIPISILQIAVSGIIIAVMYIYISPFFTGHFTNTLSGLAFPAFFYGVQRNIFSSWHDLDLKMIL